MAAASTSKAARCSAVSPGGAADRISDLPDALRSHILTLLPLRSAIRTGVLSRHWLGLWKQNLSILNLTMPPETNITSFTEDVQRRLTLHPPPRRLDALRLVFPARIPTDTCRIRRWLNHASDCGVTDLHLDLTSTHPIPKFDFEMDGGSILLLSLRWCQFHHVHRSGNLQALEELHLHQVAVKANLLLGLFSLPRLRLLDFRNCTGLLRLPRRRPTNIRTLTFVDCNLRQISLRDCPELRSLRFSHVPQCIFGRCDLLPLDDAYFSWGLRSLPSPSFIGVRAFNCIQNVRVLTLGGIPLQRIVAIDKTKQFNQLKELQLLMNDPCKLSIDCLSRFFLLFRFPSLEKLFIELPDISDPIELAPPPPVIRSGLELESLRLIKMTNFDGAREGMIRLVYSFLEKAVHLERMILVTRPVEGEVGNEEDDNTTKMCALYEKLQRLHKASTNAEILLYESDTSDVRPMHFRI